ncbi:hypothetical protein L3V16_21365 [Brucella ciceri]|uniref:hypothetical protein n=1 Tax=Brucella ciceri TaxID=391287 RepID=UPI000DE2006F|nr:hypothetical protein [Brucella ciceri]MCH6206377.1 hypothetical protein [Brucella ciceri]
MPPKPKDDIERKADESGDYPADAMKVLDGLELRVREPVPDEVTCLKCGWVSFAITRAAALKEIEKFNDWYRNQPSDVKARYGHESSLEQYRCLRCQGTEFRPASPGDAPRGVTLNPVVWEPDGDQE